MKGKESIPPEDAERDAIRKEIRNMRITCSLLCVGVLILSVNVTILAGKVTSLADLTIGVSEYVGLLGDEVSSGVGVLQGVCDALEQLFHLLAGG